MNKKSVFILIPLCLFLTSCLTWKDEPSVPSPNAQKPSESIEAVKEPAEEAHGSVKKAADLVTESVDGIKDANRDIADGTKNIKKKDPKGNLNSEVGNIEKGVAKTVGHLKGLEQAGKELTEAERKILETSALLAKAEGDAKTFEAESAKKDDLIKNSASEIAERDKRISDLENENAMAFRHKLYYIVIAGLVALAAAAWMFVQGNAKAIAMGSFAVVLIIGSLAVSFFMKGMGLVGFIVVGVTFVLLAWQMFCEYQRRQKEKSKDKANKELVKTVEHVKGHIDNQTRVKLFGGRVDDGEVGNLQSEDTKILIREHRKKLKEEFDPIT